MNRILHLTLKRKFFDAIASGEKYVERRVCTEYWAKRLTWQVHDITDPKQHSILVHPKRFTEVHFRNGYRKDSPFMRVEWKGLRISLRKDNYEILLGKVLEIRNWPTPKGEKA